MIHPLLRTRLEPIATRLRRLRFLQALALGWSAAAGVAAVVWVAERATGWSAPIAFPLVAVAGPLAALAFAFLRASRPVDLRTVATEIERLHPDLRGLLLTAVQQEAEGDASLSYLQRRVILGAVEHGESHDWLGTSIPGTRLGRAALLHFAALAAFLVALSGLRVERPVGAPAGIFVRTGGLTVTPGDAQLERGSSLVVLARFGSAAPAHAELVLTPRTGGAERRLPLARNLADPVFGASVNEVTNDFTYRIEYGDEKSREFDVRVFEFPRLDRADAQVTYPTYTGEPAKRLEQTRRVSAVQGSRLDLALQLNKPVASARLVPRGTNSPAVALAPDPRQPRATLTNLALESSTTYELQLVDADGRTNKEPAQFVFQVLTNRVPELKLASPRGDQRPSALEEVRFEGTVWDDFGVLAYGLAWSRGSGDPVFVELGRQVPARERRPFRHELRLEELGAKPDDLLSWFVWADDIGPDGQVRRTLGDLFFAEVRPFEEVFRESNQSASGQDQQQGEQENEGGSTARLAELQKQVVNATWKLRREQSRTAASQLSADTQVVRDSQAQAIQRAEQAAGEARDPRLQPLWKAVVESMNKARAELDAAVASPDRLATALPPERDAYQNLLRLRDRETQVARSRNQRQQGGGGGGDEMRQRQLDELEFSNNQDRYETRNQAQASQDPARREQLQVLNRLQELARRQEDVNSRLQELQTALQQADNDREREELRRQLKRLQEEQQRMLADMDELQQRLQRPENQSAMEDQSRRLEQARSDMQRSSDAAAQGNTSQALAAGSRAQRELQEARDEFRRQSSSAFAEDARRLREDARELAREQQEINRQLEEPETPRQRTLSSANTSTNQAVGPRLSAQRQRLTNLVERATQVARASEESEPLLSRHLEETLRQLNQDEAAAVNRLQEDLLQRGVMTRGLYDRLRNLAAQGDARSLDAASEMLRQGNAAEAAEASRRVASNFENLQRGVSRAAESVLGDEAEALRQARDQLDELARQVEREIAASSSNALASAARSGNRPGEQGQNSQTSPTGQGQQGQGQQGQGQQGQGQQGQGQQGQGQQGQGQQGQGQQGQGQQGQGQQGQGQQGQGQQGQGQQGQGQQGQGQQGQGQRGQGRGQGQNGQDGDAADADGNTPAELAANSPGAPNRNPSGRNRAGNRPNGGANPAGGGGFDVGAILGSGPAAEGAGPLTGADFSRWADRLREVEEMVDRPDLRNDLANARERARITRTEFRRDQIPPDWGAVRRQILGPLVEVRQKVADELARRESNNPLVPIDRDPVPGRYSELVRRYYEELGKDSR